MRKMSLVPTRAGYAYECFYCKSPVTAEAADSHECIPMHEGHDARVDNYPDKRLVECFTCTVLFTVPNLDD